MKRLLTSIVVIILLSAGSAARAEEEKGGNNVSVTLKTWVNEWKHNVPGAVQQISDNVSVLFGPVVEAECRNGWITEASYLMSLPDYKFTDAGVTSKFDRRDFDLALGKRLNRYAGFFVGYRNSSFKEQGTGAKGYSYGLTYSLRGTAPFIGTSSLYGNLTYLSARFKAEGQAREEAPGWISEIGGRTVFTKQIALKIGYKWETTEGETTKVKDSFRGTVIDLTYAF